MQVQPRSPVNMYAKKALKAGSAELVNADQLSAAGNSVRKKSEKKEKTFTLQEHQETIKEVWKRHV